ncbi:CDP-glycerol glycerophosphotransferase family protein [Actinocorallia sp. API 0066]|uniref:bifunctional glycosyltransferase/CDP-glycerol:glycerophosphate glycerophosphotransferase n=1 Tax=Actinocorallia sp. API 0066 TaxID=2896846 RepID=UPI001E3F8102|nr:CDP-glycerol glycerophosphotransferase family protein [Actinocorallia sp. API 0066]MCD0453178.1 CDP-glycerol glycerophosphotransferase family protein [Actinocorallia sp. API 0066]
MSPRLSVVVPIYNVERYLPACLDSLTAQTFADFEVIVVDDGSTDGGALIAKSYSRRDRRFTLIQQENRGPGPARNLGVSQARGELLAFVDGDDLVHRDAYASLVGSLDRTGSDLASGGLRRFGSRGVRHSPLHRAAFVGDRLATHISRFPDLVADRIVWNKVWRRSFWDRTGLEFAAGLYEDIPVALRSHVRARSVDVLSGPVYLWRVRDAGEASITERSGEPANAWDRLAVLREMREVIAAEARSALPAFDRFILEFDLPKLAWALDASADAGAAARIREFVAGLDPAAGRDLPSHVRLRNHLLGRGMLAELGEVLRGEAEAESAPVVRCGRVRRRWLAAYPFLHDPEVGVPDDVYDVTDELQLRTRVKDVWWEGDVLFLEGHAYISRIETLPQDRMRAWVVEAKTGKRRRCGLRRVPAPEATVASAQSAVSHDASGFVLEIPALPRGDWRVVLELSSGGLKRTAPLGRPMAGRASWTPHLHVGVGFRAQAMYDEEGLFVRVRRIRALVTSTSVDEEGLLTARGWVSAHGETALVATCGTRRLAFPVRREGQIFTVEVPLAKLNTSRNDTFAGSAQWDLRIAADDQKFTPLAEPSVAEARWADGDTELAVTRTRYGALAVVVRPAGLTLTDLRWDHGALVMDGRCSTPDLRPGDVLLRCGHLRHRLPVVWSGDGFRITLNPADLPGPSGRAPLAAGTWELLVELPEGERPVVLERRLLPALPPELVVAGRVYEPTYGEGLRLRAARALADDECGAYAQRKLREEAYPRYRTEPVTDTAVFLSGRGATCAGGPRAVFEELRRRDTGLDLVWLSSDDRFTAPEGARIVGTGTREAYRLLARARYVVSDGAPQPWHKPGDGRTWLRTGPGVSLCRPMEAPGVPADVLFSPGPQATALLREGLGHQGEVLEIGSPANDLLFAPDAAARAARVRDRLRLPADRRIVLYVPAWRGGTAPGGTARFDLRFDLAEARARLGGGHVLLLRAHPATGGTGLRDDAFVRDVTWYPDITELYLIADVLVTDYSSAMFDFALTHRPMIFYPYDLAAHRDNPGFLLPYEATVPGPVAHSPSALLDALASTDEVAATFRRTRHSFTARFTPAETGTAAARAIDHLLARHPITP